MRIIHLQCGDLLVTEDEEILFVPLAEIPLEFNLKGTSDMFDDLERRAQDGPDGFA